MADLDSLPYATVREMRAQIRDEIIEECARVAEFYGWDSGGTRIIPSTSREIATAIRALKDKI